MEKRTRIILFIISVLLIITAVVLSILITRLLSSTETPFFDFVPKPDQDKNPDSSLIWLNREEERDKSFWADQLTNFVQKYKNSTNPNGYNCRYENDKGANEDNFCIVDTEKMKGCISKYDDQYGYTDGISKPCVLLKLNPKEGWKPLPFMTANDLELAEKRKMPKELIDRIKILNETNPIIKRQMNTIWISCEGETSADRENVGEIKYYAPGFPNENFPGIPGFYFPYLKQDGYQNPFVFIKFENPQVNILIRVVCKAWAVNIQTDPDKDGPLGLVKIELLID